MIVTCRLERHRLSRCSLLASPGSDHARLVRTKSSGHTTCLDTGAALRRSLTERGKTSDGPPSEPVSDARLAAARAFDERDTRSDLALTVFDSYDDCDPGSGHAVRYVAGPLNITLSSSGCAQGGLLVHVDPAPSEQAILTLRVQRGVDPIATRPGSQEWNFLPAPSGPISILLVDGARRVRTEWTRW